MATSQGSAIRPETGSYALASTVRAMTGTDVHRCYQCRKCSAGCPMSWAMDLTPAQLIHAIRLGQEEIVFQSKTMWLCPSCHTCSTRCPQEVDVAKIMDACKILATRKGVEPKVPRVAAFNRVALKNIRFYGRMYELGLVTGLKFRTGEFTKDFKLGLHMLLKGELALVPPISPSRSFTMWRIFSRVKNREGRFSNGIPGEPFETNGETGG